MGIREWCNKSEVRDIEAGLGSDREVRAERKRKREGEGER